MEEAVTVLVVDDEPSIRFFLEEVLNNEGYGVVTAASGEEALAHLEQQEFDLVLLDLKLPGVGGLDVLEVIRQQWPATVVIVLTAHASLESVVETMRQGAHDYLFKPCKTIALRESVRDGLLKREELVRNRALQRSIPAEQKKDNALLYSPNKIRAGIMARRGRFLRRDGLVIDFMRHIITFQGQLLELSPTEFDLLAYLTSEAPRIIPARELVREVQGYEADEDEAREVVRYHIYRIRRKVKESTGCTDLIETVRGVGYGIGEAHL